MPLLCFFLPDHSLHCATYAREIWAIRNNMHPAYNRWIQRQQFCLHEGFGYLCLVKSSFKSTKKKFILYCMLTPFVSGQTDWLMELCLKTHALICKEVICDMLWGIHLQLFAFSIHFFCPVLTFKPCSGYGALQFWGLAIWEVCFLLAK